MEEMAKEYAKEPGVGFAKVQESWRAYPPPKRRSVKRMMWDRAVSCFTASCMTQKKKMETVVPHQPRGSLPCQIINRLLAILRIFNFIFVNFLLLFLFLLSCVQLAFRESQTYLN
ncbi:hypothetical protein ACJRO7_024427 [Eucalyptus globulus]|uniref:Uncharacterized protein n=1 Tax=Eucalyptus globulus TaxID=34317 RepID=A0ABD3KAR6_EUCGL